MNPTRPGPPPAQSVETLKASLASLIAESQALRQDVHGAEIARKRANQINVGVLAVLALFVGLLFAVVWQNNQVVRQVSATNAVMVDCTTPGRPCNEQGRQRTEAAVASIARISIYVSQCGRLWPGESGPEYDKKIEACVLERLAKAQHATSVTPSPAPVPSPRPGG